MASKLWLVTLSGLDAMGVFSAAWTPVSLRDGPRTGTTMLMPVSGAVIWRVDSRKGRLRSMMPMMSVLTASGTTPGLSAVMMSSRARSWSWAAL